MSDTLDIGPDGDISAWPCLKTAHAREHCHDLMARVGAWNARRLYKCPIVVGSDRATLNVPQVEMPNSPDVEWSLCFADAIHDVRVALESLAWELAHLNGASPKNPKDVNFPIARSPEALNRKLDAVFPRIHSKVAERIKYFQSFNIDDPERSWLSIISDLDNEDKHRGAVFTAPSMTGASFHFGELGMGPEVAGDGGSRVEYVEPLSSVPVGGNLASITFGLEI